MTDASAIREKEATAFAAQKADYDANIAALSKAAAALDKGMAGAFLQTNAANILRNLAQDGKHDIADVDRQDILAFLSSGQSDEYAPQSGQISGILKQIKDEMSKSSAAAVAAEEEAIKNYEALMAAKNKEVGALTAAIE